MECDTLVGASLFCEAMEAPESQHRLSQDLWRRFADDLQRVAGGGAVSSSLAHEVAVFRMFPLTEAPAEGYHRDVSRVARTTPSARLPFAFASLRLRDNMHRLMLALLTPDGQERLARGW